jgi:tRNA (guanine-N7-)-methyltransferase
VRKAKRLSLEELAPYLLNPPDPPAVLNWSTIFGNDHPVELEIGFGKGAVLVAAGQARSEVNFVGVEIDRALQLYVASRLARRSLRNVRLVKADARQFVRDCVADASVAAVHVYFPDPWWKTRHKKRRVFTGEFAAACQRVLRPDGRLLLATDVEEYFGVMTNHVAEHTRLKPISWPAQDQAWETNFERKARQQGRSVWRAAYLRP